MEQTQIQMTDEDMKFLRTIALVLPVILLSVLLHECGHIIMFEILGIHNWEIHVTNELIGVAPIITSQAEFDYYYGTLALHSVFGGIFAGIMIFPFAKIDIHLSFVSYFQIGYGLLEPMLNKLRSRGDVCALEFVFVGIFLVMFATAMTITTKWCRDILTNIDEYERDE